MNTVTTTIAITQPTAHLIDVQLAFVAGDAPVVVRMPVWTPGSYLVREYARHVRDVVAIADGTPIAWRKIDKRSWQVVAPAGAQVVVSYRVYAYELTVRTNHVDDTHAFFNPAAVVMQVDGVQGPLPVIIDAPAAWQVATQLTCDAQTTAGDRGLWHYTAADYDACMTARSRSARTAARGFLSRISRTMSWSGARATRIGIR